MKQISILFFLFSFLFSTGIWANANSTKADSNVFTVKDKKGKGKNQVKEPKKEKEEKSEENSEEEESEGEKGFGGNKYIFDKNKDKKKK